MDKIGKFGKFMKKWENFPVAYLVIVSEEYFLIKEINF